MFDTTIVASCYWGGVQKDQFLKCPYSQKFFLGFGISVTSKNVFKPKKLNSDAFCHKIKLWISCFGHANEVDSIMKDWWRMTSLQEYLEALRFYLALLMTALLRQLQFVFCCGNLTTTETTVTWTLVSFAATRAGVTQRSDVHRGFVPARKTNFFF